MSQTVQIEALQVFPVKSCRGIELESAQLTVEGLRYDREWMIVDGRGVFITQRERPELARVLTHMDSDFLSLSALGNGRVSVPLRYADGAMTPVRCWRYSGEALHCGSEAAAWLTDLLGSPARLVRFSRHAKRQCNAQWTGEIAAYTKFSDGYPILVLATESVADLRQRMNLDHSRLPDNRFRANLMISGLAAYDEDFVDTIGDPNFTLKLVKPCTRCTVPGVDQTTGSMAGPAPIDVLTSYRMNPAVDGATLGVNAIVARGAGATLTVGIQLAVGYRFG
jgi:uncharacterized protein